MFCIKTRSNAIHMAVGVYGVAFKRTLRLKPEVYRIKKQAPQSPSGAFRKESVQSSSVALSSGRVRILR